MSYPPQQPYQPPVVPGAPQSPAGWTPAPSPPAPAKSRAVPILIGVVVVLVLLVAGLGFALISKNGGVLPTTSDKASFDQIRSDCSVVAGYQVEDNGQTLVLTVGGAYMSTSTADCVFTKLSVPDAVRQHVATTRALDGQQTDSWSGYTARWTYHPDDGLQMTIRAS